MEKIKPSSAKVGFKWAIICFVISVVLTYVFQFLDMSQSVVAKIVGYIPFIAFSFLAVKEYRDQLGGYMTFGEGFMPGLLYGIFYGLMTAVFIFVYLKYLSPQILEQSIAEQKDKLAQQGLSDEQIDNALQIARKYGALFGAIATAIIIPIIGAVIALIAAAVFKKERTVYDAEPADPAV
ncbi:MAG TPA: DUF4199 domain-containing protein [Mucilaginibacter sp.]|nr:DUF4199 domain-containing protein [Mucilaginibacter sp.]HVW12744.1 DUF4199 domain-containing protein [Mucilaginibacter sp.]